MTLARKREWEERRRRGCGVVGIGSTIQCARCGCSVTRTSSSAKYCALCRDEAQRQQQREAGRRHYAASAPRVRDPAEERERQARYRARNREKVRARSAAYNDANRELVNSKSRARSQTEERRAYVRAWEGRKAAADPAFVLNRRMKQAVRRALRGGKAGRSWEALVGYTAERLRDHIERQFTKGMTWANIGEWHIDHIIPKASFEYESADDPAFRACWALTNLRPLWGPDNLAKSSKRLHLI